MGLHALGDSAWLFKAGGWSSENKLGLILRLRRLLELNPIPEIVDIVSSFDTIAVHFHPADGQKILDHLTSLHIDQSDDFDSSQAATITIPVVYGGENCPDLLALARATKLSVSHIISSTALRNTQSPQ